MSYLFNNHGWYTGTGDSPRSTEIEPTNKSTAETVGELRSVWNERGWSNIAYVAPDTSGELAAQKIIQINKVVNLQYQKSDTTIDFFGKTLNTNMEAVTELTGALDGMRRSVVASRKVNMRTGRALTNTATIEAMVDVIDAHRQACHDRGYDLGVLIDAATTLGELEAIDITTGWPS